MASPLLFLSHAGADGAAVDDLAQRIEASPTARKSGLKVWIDRRDLQAGRSWMEQIEEAIALRSSAFGLYFTHAGAGGWVRMEVEAALDRVVALKREDKVYPFIPIFAEDRQAFKKLPPFARLHQGVTLGEDGAGIDDLIRAALGIDSGQPVALVEDPFLGLSAFDSDYAGLFFGRKEETRALIDRLKATNLVMVLGESGSGKSSLVRAGLVPAFREGSFADQDYPRPDPTRWHVVEMRPGLDPFEGLVEGVMIAAKSAGVRADMLEVLPRWIRTKSPEGIRDALRESGNDQAHLLLVIDQFEELWTQSKGEARSAFIRVLLDLARAGGSNRRIVATLRGDYYDDCREEARDLHLRLEDGSGRFVLPRMREEGLRAAVEKPLVLAGVPADSAKALADAVLRDVREQPADLALLQMALTETWRRRSEFDGDLLRAYDGIGRVEGALAVAAEDVFSNQKNQPEKLLADERPIAESLFMRLVRLGDSGARSATRRSVRRRELTKEGWEVAQKLANEYCRRLLVIGTVPGADAGPSMDGPDSSIAEIAHEKLVTQWDRYRGWLRYRTKDPHRVRDKRNLDLLLDRAERWQQRGRKKDSLVSGHDLAEFRELEGRRRSWLSDLERDFIHESRSARRNKLIFTYGSVVCSVSAIFIAAMVALWFGMEAQKRGEALRSQGILVLVRSARDPLVGALLLMEIDQQNIGLEGVRVARSICEESIPAFVLRGHEKALHLALFSPDGRLIVTASEDGTARVWNGDGSGEPVILKGHQDGVVSASFSPDGKRIVTASYDKTACVWNSDGSGVPVILKGHEGWLFGASFGPDGKKSIVTASGDHTARVWDTDGSGEPVILKGHEGVVDSAGFSPDGKRVVTGSWDNTARVWNADGSGETVILTGHQNPVVSASFSPDGKRVVTASEDNSARVWNADGSGAPVILNGHGIPLSSASFSPDGKRVVAASGDNMARIWNAEGSGEPVILKGHEGLVLWTSFSPDGKRVVTASLDETARVWNADGSGEPIIFKGHKISVRSASFSPDGKRVVTASADNTARVWNAGGSREPVILLVHGSWVRSAAFSPDGKRVLTASGDNSARVWNADGSGEPVILKGHESSVRTASFSSDGRRIVTASLDSTARVWNADSPEEPVILKGHTGSVHSASFSPDGKRILTAAAEDETARVWNADGLGEPVILKGHEGWVVSASFSPEGRRVATASKDETARVWNADGSGKPVILKGHEGRVVSALFSPDGNWVVTASEDMTARVWNADGIGEPVVLYGHRSSVRSASFSPEGKRVVTASLDNTARVWNADGSGEPIILGGHENPVISASFSPDGKWVVTASDDMTARVWNADGSGNPIVLKGHGDLVSSASFSSDGKRVVTASRDSTARVWMVDFEEIVKSLRARTTECLRPEERMRYLGESKSEADERYDECRKRNHP
jgi:WD40 repeat protein